MITLTASAHCHACDWTAEGDPEATDKAGAAHTRKTSHATGVIAVPAVTR